MGGGRSVDAAHVRSQWRCACHFPPSLRNHAHEENMAFRSLLPFHIYMQAGELLVLLFTEVISLDNSNCVSEYASHNAEVPPKPALTEPPHVLQTHAIHLNMLATF